MTQKLERIQKFLVYRPIIIAYFIALQAEIRHLRDSNKAMTLYINEIIGRLLQTQGFERVLERDVRKPLPAVPPSQSHPGTPRRQYHESGVSVEILSRRPMAPEVLSHKRMSTEIQSAPPSNLGGGLSRAFSFRK